MWQCLGGRGGTEWGTHHVFEGSLQECISIWRRAKESRQRGSELVYIRETGKGQSLKEPWMGIKCICETL